uniref:CSON005155 protein n=1 Tax=Culicoides sonorensis TaxID=179676 RepID=A0A336MQQ0_CULSO
MYTFNGGLSAPPLLSIDSGGGGGNGINDQNHLCVQQQSNCNNVNIVINNGSGNNNSNNNNNNNIPRTPEILNSLIAMTNPLEYSYPSDETVAANNCTNNSVSTSNQTCSQLIKAGIKLHIQNKRKYSGCESSGNESMVVATASKRSNYSRKRADTTTDNMTSEEESSNHGKSPRIGLTPEDEDRRRRRRERNKIAATKCRMKKRERTVNLVNESETLETQNIDFKNQIRELENERRKLMGMLQAHSPHCVHQGGYQPLPSVSTLKNCKYLNELQNYCDSNQQIANHHNQLQSQQHQQAPQIEQPEIKYSQTLKEQQEMMDYSMLPHGYCKPSPTDTSYVLSPDSGFVKSPIDLDSSSQYSDQLPMQQHHPHACQQQQHINNNHAGHLKSQNNYNIPTSNDAILSNNNSNNLNNNNNNNNNSLSSMLVDSEIFLKTELIDPSPYTTIQSADRFLFESTDTTFDSDKMLMHCNGGSPMINGGNHIINSNTLNNVNNLLMDSFDTNIIKADFLSQNQEFNIATMVDGTDTQFTDLDSGIIKSLNNGCLTSVSK